MTDRPDDAATPAGDDAAAPDPAAVAASASEADQSDAATASETSAVDAAPSDAAGAESPAVERRPSVERDDVQVQARLVPRYGRFMVLGAIVGAIGGWLWSRTGSSGPLLGSGPVVDTSAVIPFLIAVGALVGVVVGAVVAIVLDRLVGRRRRTVTAERTRHHRADAD